MEMNILMDKCISSDIRDLLTKESLQYITDDMITDIYYVVQHNNIKKAILEYDNKILEIKKIETGGTHLQLTVDGKNIEVVPK